MLGTRVKQRLDELGMGQDELAKLCGVSQAAVHKVIAGKTKNPGWIAEMSDTLGVSIFWLKRGVDDARMPERSENPKIEHKRDVSQEIGRFLLSYNSLSRDARREVDEILRGILKINSDTDTGRKKNH